MKLNILVAAMAIGVSAAASAQNEPVKIGFITDMSGLYADICQVPPVHKLA